MLKNMNAACIGNDKSITFFWAEVQRENPYQFQTLNVLQNDGGLVVTREAFDIDDSCLYEPFTFSTKVNDQAYSAWSTLKKKATIFVPENKQIVVPRDGILFGGDTSPDNLFAMYQPDGLLQWNLNFGPSKPTISVTINKNGMNQTSAKVHREFIINLRNASKKNYDETLDKFLNMIDEARTLVKKGR